MNKPKEIDNGGGPIKFKDDWPYDRMPHFNTPSHREPSWLQRWKKYFNDDDDD